MTREDARKEIRSRISCTDYLTKSKNGLYCCPFCHSGEGPSGTGALKLYDTNTWTCHKCKRSGDVIDLFQEATGTGFNEALSLLAKEINITIDAGGPAADFGDQGGTRPRPEVKAPETALKTPAEGTADYTAYYRKCRERLADPAAAAYLQSRGISVDTAAAYWIGFDPAADPANAPGADDGEYKPHACPRLIIPTGKTFYTGRRIDGKEEYRYSNAAAKKGAGAPGIFNERALYENETVFITEGALDALSFLEAGAAAVALNSANNADKLVKHLAEKRTDATLILCLDNDNAGREATPAIKDGLQRLNISYITADVCGGHKDPNEALTADRAAFEAAIAKAQAQTAARPDNVAAYLDNLMAGELDRFKEAKDRKTGFDNLDKEAGGLYSGLYVIAAVSSLGKTTFCHQMADQLAAAGHEVLFFSLEQSRLELVSKSIARTTAQQDIKTAVTSLQIRRGYLPAHVLSAADAYKDSVQDRLSIIEGNFACTTSFIGDYARQYVRRTGSRPILIIDYLQILQGDPDKRQSTKEMIDSTVTDLKRLSRELDLTVFVISSVNRANYLAPIDFESLKESGGIEYTADVIWGLQLQCLNEPLFDQEKKIKEKRQKIKEAKAADPRKIELLCLKNRYGISSYSCYFDYFPRFDLFRPGTCADFDEAPPKQKRY